MKRIEYHSRNPALAQPIGSRHYDVIQFRNAYYTIRLRRLWVSGNLRSTNSDTANQFLKTEYRKGWTL